MGEVLIWDMRRNCRKHLLVVTWFHKIHLTGELWEMANENLMCFWSFSEFSFNQDPVINSLKVALFHLAGTKRNF